MIESESTVLLDAALSLLKDRLEQYIKAGKLSREELERAQGCAPAGIKLTLSPAVLFTDDSDACALCFSLCCLQYIWFALVDRFQCFLQCSRRYQRCSRTHAVFFVFGICNAACIVRCNLKSQTLLCEAKCFSL
jgi:hypothetical protein